MYVTLAIYCTLDIIRNVWTLPLGLLTLTCRQICSQLTSSLVKEKNSCFKMKHYLTIFTKKKHPHARASFYLSTNKKPLAYYSNEETLSTNHNVVQGSREHYVYKMYVSMMMRVEKEKEYAFSAAAHSAVGEI